MARLIEKEYVGDYGGDVVYLETHTGAGLVQILAFSYRHRQGADGEETVNSVEWAGFDEHDEYDMDYYGITWRLWDVFVETPSVQQMSRVPWE